MSRLGAALTTLGLAAVVLADPRWWSERPALIIAMMILTGAAWTKHQSYVGSLLAPVVIGLAGWIAHPVLMGVVATLAIGGLALGDPTSDRIVPSKGAVAMVCAVVAGLVLTPVSFGPLGQRDDSAELPESTWQSSPETVAAVLAGMGPATSRQEVAIAPQIVGGLDLSPPGGVNAGLRDFDSLQPGPGSTPDPADESSGLLWLLLGLVGVGVILGLWWRLRRAGFEAPPINGAVRNQSLVRLEMIGGRLGRPRAVSEPPLAFARALDAMTGDRSFGAVGAGLASALYAPGGQTTAELSELLGELEERYG